jgi:predicted RNase H-like HicB family nuclease
MPEQPNTIVERDGEWFIATSHDVPGANGQDRTREECMESLRLAIELIHEDCRQDALARRS